MARLRLPLEDLFEISLQPLPCNTHIDIEHDLQQMPYRSLIYYDLPLGQWLKQLHRNAFLTPSPKNPLHFRIVPPVVLNIVQR